MSDKETFYRRLKIAPHEFSDGTIEPAQRHMNPDGQLGGMVGDSCVVDDTCWIHPLAEVFHCAQITDYCILLEGVSVCGFAVLKHGVRVFEDSIISGVTVIEGDYDVGVGCKLDTGRYANHSSKSRRQIADYTVSTQ